MQKNNNGDVVLSAKELKELSKAYLGLFEILSDQPSSVQEYFDSHKDFMNVAKWHDILEQGEFHPEDWG